MIENRIIGIIKACQLRHTELSRMIPIRKNGRQKTDRNMENKKDIYEDFGKVERRKY